MLDRYQQVCEALKILAGLGVEPGFAAKLLIGLPDDPGRAHTILFREVLRLSNDDVSLWIERLFELNSRIQDLVLPPGPHQEHELIRTLEMRNKIFQALQGALDHIDRHMPAVWTWLVLRYWQSHKRDNPKENLPQRPSADPRETLAMALIVDHLEQHGKQAHYHEVEQVIRIMFPVRQRQTRSTRRRKNIGAKQLTEAQKSAEVVRSRVNRFQNEMKTLGINRDSRLAAVDFFWRLTVQKL